MSDGVLQMPLVASANFSVAATWEFFKLPQPARSSAMLMSIVQKVT